MTLREEIEKIANEYFDDNILATSIKKDGIDEIETLVNDQITSFAERVKSRKGETKLVEDFIKVKPKQFHQPDPRTGKRLPKVDPHTRRVVKRVPKTLVEIVDQELEALRGKDE